MLCSLLLNIDDFSILPLMALNSLYCADVPLSNYSLTSTRILILLLPPLSMIRFPPTGVGIRGSVPPTYTAENLTSIG